MRFSRYGRTYQLKIKTVADLAACLDLDDALWVATSAPVGAFRCNPRFLELLDTDHNGRITSNELKSAIRWFLDQLQDPIGVETEQDWLPLTALREGDQGTALVRSAVHVLEKAGESAHEKISLQQVRGFLASAMTQPLNGDGVIVPEAAQTPEMSTLIRDAIAATGGTRDRGGRLGVTRDQSVAFLADAAARLHWLAAVELPEGTDHSDLMPLGTSTPEAWALLQKHAPKVDAFFAQCELLAFAPDTAQNLMDASANGHDATWSDPQSLHNCLREGPLAQPSAEGQLPLTENDVNPAYRQWVSELRDRVIGPLLGEAPDDISAPQWQQLNARFALYTTYREQECGAALAALTPECLHLYGTGHMDQLTHQLADRDERMSEIVRGVEVLEKLLLFQNGLLQFASNFVSFPHLYDPTKKALFEYGAIVIDERWLTMVVKVDDVNAHAAMARLSAIFTVYLEITGTSGEPKFTVAAPVTSGGHYNLAVGKRGVYFDIDGRQRDARIIQVIEHPVSLAEAVLAPFVRLGQMLAGKIEAFSTSGEKQLQGEMQNLQSITTTAPQDTTMSSSKQAGIFVGMSVALAALSSAFAFIIKTLAGLKIHQFGLGLTLAVVAVLVPVTLVAWLKLRKRDLSALLEGCGWAINARMRLTRRQGHTFTRTGHFPADAIGKPLPHWVRALLYAALTLAILGALLTGARHLSALNKKAGALADSPPVTTTTPE